MMFKNSKESGDKVMKEILLKDIVQLLDGNIELYYKGSWLGEYTAKELIEQKHCLEDKVVSIAANEDIEDYDKICVYLTASGSARMF